MHVGTEAFAQTHIQDQQMLRKAEQFLLSSMNDSALFYLQPVLRRLEKRGLADAPFGLRVQLASATALAQDDRNVQAMALLNTLRDKSKALEAWKTFAGACLALTVLHEKLNRFEDAKINLDYAHTAIARHNLDSLYPAFAVRMAFRYSIYGYADSMRYFALEAIKTSRQFGLPAVEAEAYLLLGRGHSDKDMQQAAGYYKKAVELLKGLSDYRGLSHLWYTISLLYERNAYFKEALKFNDSTIMACYKAIATGTERIPVLHMAYQYRGRIFHNLGYPDSAMYYYKRGYTQEILFVQQEERYRVVEIDERYKNKQKTAQIAAQAQQLRFERQRLFGLLVVVAIILFSAAVLVYYYLRLQKANRLTLQQANIIKEANEQLAQSLERQVMLQGEIHHRVKNNLQVIISLLELQKDEIKDQATRNSLDAMAARIFSMAAVHDVLYQKEGENLVDFLEYTKKLCEHLSAMTTGGKPRFKLQIPKQFFNLETLMPLGIMLNELLTNSMKYASQERKQLRIDVQLKPHKGGFRLYYKDNGPGFSSGKLTDREGGLGAYLLRSMSRQLSGSLETKNDGGAAYTIYFQEKNRAA